MRFIRPTIGLAGDVINLTCHCLRCVDKDSYINYRNCVSEGRNIIISQDLRKRVKKKEDDGNAYLLSISQQTCPPPSHYGGDWLISAGHDISRRGLSRTSNRPQLEICYQNDCRDRVDASIKKCIFPILLSGPVLGEKTRYFIRPGTKCFILRDQLPFAESPVQHGVPCQHLHRVVGSDKLPQQHFGIFNAGRRCQFRKNADETV